MTVEATPWALNSESTDSAVARHALQGVLGGAVGAFAGGIGATRNAAHGVCNPGDLAVSQSTSPGMSVRVAAGTAFVTGTASALQGPYAFYNDAAIDVVAIAAADATNPRNDLVCAQVRDTTYDASGFSDARIFVVTGTPAAVPVDPTPPASCLVLARVNVPALDTSITNAQITDLRTRAGGSVLAYPAAICVVDAVRSINDATVTDIDAWGTVVLNPLGWSTSGGAVTPTTAGFFLVLGRSEHVTAVNDVTRRITRVTKNGAPTNFGADEATAGATSQHAQASWAVVQCNGSSDTIGLEVYQDNSANATRNLNAGMVVVLLWPM